MIRSLLGTPKRYGPLFLYKKWDPYAPPDNPHSLNCEFTDPADASKFIQVNTTTNSVTFDVATTLAKGLDLRVPTQQYRWRCFLKPHPGNTEYTYFAGVDFSGWAASTLISSAGIVLSTTATTNTGSQSGLAILNNSDSHHHRGAQGWNNFGESAGGAAVTDYGIAHVRHVRYRKSGGLHFFAWSHNGETYMDTQVTPVTPSYVGIYGQNYNGQTGLSVGMHFSYFRYYPTGDVKKSGRLVNVYR